MLDPQGKERTWSERILIRETWRRTAAGWKLLLPEDLDYVLLLDGKRVSDPYNPFGQAQPK